MLIATLLAATTPVAQAMPGMDMDRHARHPTAPATARPKAPPPATRRSARPVPAPTRPPSLPVPMSTRKAAPTPAGDNTAVLGTTGPVASVPAPQDAAMADHGAIGDAMMDHGTPDHATMDHAAPDHAAMDHAAMGHGAMPDMAMHGMTGLSGDYAMMRDASGTAWQPDSSPLWAIMGRSGDWSTMIHGYATLVQDDQGGPRGGEKTFVASMLMGMAQRPVGGGALTLRAMGSLDPLMGRSGYPLLLATGETADGRTELVDRQHPHDAVMELSVAYSRPLGGDVSGFIYLALPGEPALGPATYMHRFSGIANPEAPISHHWLDSTHVTFGVASAGLVYRGVKLEGSVFTGREPDEHRWDIERPRMDSWSLRATVNPTANVSAQASTGFLRSPEGLHPEEDVRRTSASVTWNLPLGTDRNWQSTFAWGRNDPSGGDHGHATDAFLLDSAIQLRRWTLFGRAERVAKDELFGEEGGDPLAGRIFTVGKLSLGGYRSVPIGRLALDVGGLVSRYGLPRDIRPRYGADPTSYMIFTRLRISG